MVGIEPLEPGNIAQYKLAGSCRAKLHEGLHGGKKRFYSTLVITWIQLVKKFFRKRASFYQKLRLYNLL